MIDRLYTTLQTISNKDVRGNITPEEFNLLLNNVVQEKYEENFFELNRLINRQNRGLGGNSFADLPDRLREKILHYHTTTTVDKAASLLYPKPSDSRYVITLHYNGKAIPRVKNAESLHIINNTNLVGVSESKPLGMEYDNAFQVIPASITDPIEVHYLRKPKTAKWTYNPTTGLFNPDAMDFEDVDAHSSEEESLLKMLIAKLGVNLKDNELAQYGVTEEAQEFNQQNVS